MPPPASLTVPCAHNPASYRGGILHLHYTRASELEPWLDLVAVRGEVVVQFWLKPGEAAAMLGAGEERAKSGRWKGYQCNCGDCWEGLEVSAARQTPGAEVF